MAKDYFERENLKENAIENVKNYNEQFEKGIDYEGAQYSHLDMSVDFFIESNRLAVKFKNDNSLWAGFVLKGDLIDFCKLCEKNEVDFNKEPNQFHNYWETASATSLQYSHHWVYIRDIIKNYFRYERMRLTLLDILKNGNNHKIDSTTYVFKNMRIGGFVKNKTVFEYLDDNKLKSIKIEDLKFSI